MDWLALISALFFAVGCAPLAFFFPSCLCCPSCSFCSVGTSAHSQVSVLVTGISDASGSCGVTCNDLSTTYILDRVADCQWEYIFPSTICTIVKAQLDLLNASAIQFALKNSLTSSTVSGNAYLWSRSGAVNNCDWVSFDITTGPTNLFGQCFSTTTGVCEVTAL